MGARDAVVGRGDAVVFRARAGGSGVPGHGGGVPVGERDGGDGGGEGVCDGAGV